METNSQIIFKIYNNIHVFFKYRNLISIDEPVTQSDLNTQIQTRKYFIIRAIQNDESEEVIKKNRKIVNNYSNKSKDLTVKVTYMVILYPQSEFASKRADLLKLLNVITYPIRDILLINSVKVHAHIVKYINTLNKNPKQTIYPYTYNLFKTIVPEYCIVPKYTFLKKDEIEELMKFVDPTKVSLIFETDPQVIWLGGKAGQVLKYEALSETTLSTIRYRLIV